MVQFLRERADETVDMLESIPNDVPAPDGLALTNITCPTLVLACRNDLLHPFEYSQVLARARQYYSDNQDQYCEDENSRGSDAHLSIVAG